MSREGGGCAHFPENLSILKLKMESFGAFWALLFTVQLPVLHAEKLVLLSLGLGKLAAITLHAGTRKSKIFLLRDSRVKIILYEIASKMLQLNRNWI